MASKTSRSRRRCDTWRSFALLSLWCWLISGIEGAFIQTLLPSSISPASSLSEFWHSAPIKNTLRKNIHVFASVNANSSMDAFEGGGKGSIKEQQEEVDWSTLPDAPGPIRWPLVGNMITALRVGGIHKFDEVMRRKYGDVVRTKILGLPLYVISTPEAAREICSTRYKDFEDRFVAPPMARLIENKGMLFANGPTYTKNRRLTHPAFHRQQILDLACVKVVDLARQLAKHYASLPPGTTVDVHSDMRRLTLEAVTLASFSLPLGLLSEKKDDAIQLSNGRSIPFTGNKVAQLIRGSINLLSSAVQFPVPGAHRFGLNTPYRKLTKLWKELAQFEEAIIEERRANRAATSAKGGSTPEATDLLDVYLEGIELEAGEEELSNELIRKNIQDIFLAGFDTTASIIAAMLFEIVKHPNIKAKVLMEVQGLDLDDPVQMTPNAMTHRLPYLYLCLKESLRVYPVLSNIGRVAMKDTSIGGYRIPKGAVVAPSIRNLHLDPKLWGEDVLEFRPERWSVADSGGLPQGVPLGSYLPFGAGLRSCLGLRFASMEAMAVTAVILKLIDLSPMSPDQTLKVRYPVSINFKGGVPLLVNRNGGIGS